MTDSVPSTPNTSVVGGIILMGILAIILTVFTDWIGLTAYPVPVIFGFLTLNVFMQRKAATNLNWKQLSAVWGSTTLVSIATMIVISNRSADAPAPQLADARAATEVAAPQETTPLPVGTTTPIAATPSASNTIVQTSIDELLDAFDNNQIAASKRYGKPLQLSGKVVRVREALGTGILVLASPRSGRQHEFGFSDSGTEKLADVKLGDTVTITCPEALEAMSVVIVGGCSDLEVK